MKIMPTATRVGKQADSGHSAAVTYGGDSSYSGDRIAEESPLLPDAAASFRAGWRDVMAGRVYPIDTLWDGVDVE